MEIGSAGASSPSNAPQVAVFNKAKDQKEAVVATILSGVEAGPRPPGITGQRLNVAA